MKEIVNCPFCNSPRQYIAGDSKSVYVRCETCGAIGPVDKDKDRAIHAWNRSNDPAAALIALVYCLQSHAVLDQFLKEKRSKATWQIAQEVASFKS